MAALGAVSHLGFHRMTLSACELSLGCKIGMVVHDETHSRSTCARRRYSWT